MSLGGDVLIHGPARDPMFISCVGAGGRKYLCQYGTVPRATAQHVQIGRIVNSMHVELFIW